MFARLIQTALRAALNEQDISVQRNLRSTLDEYLQRAAAFGFSGAVLVAKDGQIILEKGYGWADKSLGILFLKYLYYST